jgi:hypothetical protein
MPNADEKAAISLLKEQFKHKKAQERGTSNKKLSTGGSLHSQTLQGGQESPHKEVASVASRDLICGEA